MKTLKFSNRIIAQIENCIKFSKVNFKKNKNEKD